MGRSAGAFLDAGTFWRQRINDAPGYSVIRHDNRFRANVARSSVFASAYQNCIDARNTLMHTYAGSALTDICHGTEVETEEGICLRITEEREHRQLPLKPEEAEGVLIRRLRLVPGIGPATERLLFRKGCRTIHDLLHIRRFQKSAGEVLQVIEGCDFGSVAALIAGRMGRAHPDIITASAFSPDERFCFLDIETLGVFSRPVFLIGSAELTCGQIRFHQFLARDIDEELPALLAWRDSVPPDATIISYNGRSFDLPYLADRFAYYGIDSGIFSDQIDLLHITRRLHRSWLTDCRLATVEEEVLGICRESDLPGALVPEFYDIYRRTKNPGPLLPVLKHNRQDVLSLIELLRFYREMAG
ncbi:exonuclease [Methanocalculus taiwanensis]|uniref:Exonuclease n=1 Tax=Methanocalculus taiwanensis TaxID=106207 RepID=A0ABD4TMT4_9EURY|nr:ribonuclease H-like domain-containing protein [Methanocalculus taiwanensis]MCQ1539155.1 exonuclease [Methanocalculus taiwanensis]